MDLNELFPPGSAAGAERFTIKSILGSGGMGVVCLARDRALEKDVALKFISPMLSLDEETLEGMRRETRKSQDLTHPNIVRIHDLSPSGGTPLHLHGICPRLLPEFVEIKSTRPTFRMGAT